MSLYNYFLTNPFGPGARTLEWIYLDRTGGEVTDLDSERTEGADTSGTNCRLVAFGDIAEIWQLVPGTHVSDPDHGWVRPLDYADTLNEKVWKRLFAFSTSGGGGDGGSVWITNEVPLGALNGINTTFTTTQNFQGTNIDIYLNGLRQKYTLDYSLPNTFTFIMTSAPLAGDTLIVDYIPL